MKDTYIVPILHLECDDMSRLDTGVVPHQLPEYLRDIPKSVRVFGNDMMNNILLFDPWRTFF